MLLSKTGFFHGRSAFLLLSLIIGFYLVNGIFYLRAQSLTSDEASFYNYAIRYLKGQPEKIYPNTDNSKMPVSALNTIPRIAEEYVFDSVGKKDGGTHDIINGRYITLLISILSIFFVFAWASELYNEKAGLFSAFLFSLCPNNLANAALVTTDAYSVLFLLMTFYFLWQYCKTGKQNYFLLFTLAIALSQLVKQSLFHLYILAPLCLLLHQVIVKKKWNGRIFIKQLLLFVFINLLIINTGYYFHNSFLPLGEYKFMSDLFKGVQNNFPSSLPMPFPKPYVDGLDMAKYYDQIGGGTTLSSFGNVTILGEQKTGEGIWYYYFVSLFYKTPIALIILFAWSGWLLIKKSNVQTFMRNEFFLLAPVLYFLITMSFFYKTQCGIRHILFIFPLLIILSGSLLSSLKNSWQNYFLKAATLYLMISVFSYWKNYYPYTNEFILDKKSAYQYVGSQNLDFQQGGLFLNEFLATHKNVQMAKEFPQRGLIAIAIQNYMDTWNRHTYDWLKCYQPVGHIAHNYLLLDTRNACTTK